MKFNEINEKYALNMIKYNEKLNNIVSERKRHFPQKASSISDYNDPNKGRNSAII